MDGYVRKLSKDFKSILVSAKPVTIVSVLCFLDNLCDSVSTIFVEF